MKCTCPNCKSQNVDMNVEAIEGEITFWAECKDCGFGKYVKIEEDILMSFFNVTHYDWVQSVNVYGFRPSLDIYYKPIPYDQVRDSYNKEDTEIYLNNL